VKDVVSLAVHSALLFTNQLSHRSIGYTEVSKRSGMRDALMITKTDIRFSKDPTPYKTYFSAAWSRTGRKGPYAHYYVQVQPGGGSFVGEFCPSFII
jgi:uncharacterized protein (DUF2461 family)